ncbi:metallophosphoesterase [Frondihabitans sp. 4ASC-45]|uniref:metallophosphoesterase family protein n=1 Tax=Frondihabitans sp. 4ASC-45 TaxID=3111636 RepID=UPI003C14223B
MAVTFDILHLSDTHLAAGDTRHYGQVDTREQLDLVLARASTIARLDLVACTGDLSDDGSPESYRYLRDTVEPWAAARGARVVYAMGNHDLPDGFREVLAPGADPLRGVIDVDGVRVITLDTSIPGKGYGRVGAEQLAWLADILATPAARGTVIAMHHPPVSAETPLLAALELQDPSEFAATITGTDVRLVLAGHYHLALLDEVAGARVVVSGGVTNQADLFAAPDTEGAFQGSAASVVKLRADGTTRILPFTAPAGAPVFDLDAATVASIAAEAGPASA